VPLRGDDVYSGGHGRDRCVRARRAVPLRGDSTLNNAPENDVTAPNPDNLRKFGVPLAGDLPTIIRAFKSAAARAVNQHRRAEGAILWQRNYFEKIIRNEKMLNAMRQYIAANPANWPHDEFWHL